MIAVLFLILTILESILSNNNFNSLSSLFKIIRSFFSSANAVFVSIVPVISVAMSKKIEHCTAIIFIFFSSFFNELPCKHTITFIKMYTLRPYRRQKLLLKKTFYLSFGQRARFP